MSLLTEMTASSSSTRRMVSAPLSTWFSVGTEAGLSAAFFDAGR